MVFAATPNSKMANVTLLEGCIGGQPNVLIPNRISSSSFIKNDKEKDLGAVDYLILSFSLAQES